MSAADTPDNVKTYERGGLIVEEGSPGQGWFILLTGRVAVFKKGTQIAEFSTRGMVFGEISSILAKPRTATLIAVEPTTVLYFEATLDELVTRYPKVAKTVLISLAQRLERTTGALWTAVNQAQEAMDTVAMATAQLPDPAAAPTASAAAPELK